MKGLLRQRRRMWRTLVLGTLIATLLLVWAMPVWSRPLPGPEGDFQMAVEEFRKGEKLEKDAMEYWKRGKKDQACRLWEQTFNLYNSVITKLSGLIAANPKHGRKDHWNAMLNDLKPRRDTIRNNQAKSCVRVPGK